MDFRNAFGRGKPPAWLLVLGALLLAYFNSFQGAFQFDDYNVIVDNPAVHSWLSWMGGIRPLLKATYALNWCLDPHPAGFHAVNLLIHGGNALLVFMLIQRLFQRALHRNADVSPTVLALSASLIFAVHPLQTEAVTYISGRSSSLMGLFYLGSFLAYVRGREMESWALRDLVSPILFALSLLTKETAITLPLALVLWEATTGGEFRLRTLLSARVHWAMVGIFGIILASHGGYQHLLGNSFGIRSVGENLLNQVAALGYLLAKWAWPTHLNIDPCLPFHSAWTPMLALQAAMLGGLWVLGFWNLRKRPALAFGLLWFFIQLLPTNSFIPRLDLVNERQMYLASAGLCISLLAGLSEVMGKWESWREKPRRWIWAFGVLLVLPLMWLTHLRNRDYQSEIALWESSVQAAPHNARAHNNLGCAHAYVGNVEAARKAFEAALHLDPGYARARSNLSTMTGKQPGGRRK